MAFVLHINISILLVFLTSVFSAVSIDGDFIKSQRVRLSQKQDEQPSLALLGTYAHYVWF